MNNYNTYHTNKNIANYFWIPKTEFMQKKKKPYHFELNYMQYYFIVQIVLSRNNLYDLLNFISVREVFFLFLFMF